MYANSLRKLALVVCLCAALISGFSADVELTHFKVVSHHHTIPANDISSTVYCHSVEECALYCMSDNMCKLFAYEENEPSTFSYSYLPSYENATNSVVFEVGLTSF